MSDFLEKMWTTQKTLMIVLAIILLPITVLIVFYKLSATSNLDIAKKSLNNAQAKDNQLAAEEEALKKQSASAIVDADAAAERIRNRLDEEVDLDWNTKRKD